MIDYVNSEPFNLMGITDKCLVYFESSFGDRDLIYKNVRDSVVCFLYKYRYKIVSWTILKKYKYFTLYSVVVCSLD